MKIGKFVILLVTLILTLSACGKLTGGSATSSVNASSFSGPAPELAASWAPHWTNLAGYWKMNSDFTATIGPNMTASGSGASISHSLFKAGTGSVSFDGASYAATAAASTFSFPNTTFTVSFWINTTSLSGFIVADGMVSNGWTVDLDGSGHVRVEAKNCGNHGFSMPGVGTVNDGQWHHVAAVIHTDTTVETNTTFQVYVDGAYIPATVIYPGTGPYCDPGSTRALALAARDVPVSPQAGFLGSLDEVAIWNVGLAASDIATIYNFQSGTFASLFKVMPLFTLAKSDF